MLQDGGWGLDAVLRDHSWKLRGVVNGIDTQEWHPERDAFLQADGYQNYNVHSLVPGKAACKAALQRELGLPERPDVSPTDPPCHATPWPYPGRCAAGSGDALMATMRRLIISSGMRQEQWSMLTGGGFFWRVSEIVSGG